MGMWLNTVDYGPPPEALKDPPYTPISPAWKAWLDAQEAKISQMVPPGYGPVASVSILFDVREITYSESGDTPGPWEKEDVTFTTIPPAAHKDFTRFKRTYPTIGLQRYKVITVTVKITFLNGITTDYFIFWQPDGPAWTKQNYVVHRWAQTSGLRLVGAVAGIWYDGTVPSTWTAPEATTGDLHSGDNPPASLFADPPVDVKGDLGEGSK